MSQRIITLWFKKHQYDVTNVDGLLLFSFLFPDKHNEREYGISKEVLARIIGRSWNVSKEQFRSLFEPANPEDRSDLGDRIEQITHQQDEPHPYSRTYVISIEEIEEVLLILATRHSYASDPTKIDLFKAMGNVLTDKVSPLYRRCLPMERKWLTRLIMKSYAPIVMPEGLILRLYHPRLPAMVKLFDLKAAIRFSHHIDQDRLPCINDAPATDQGRPPDTGNDENVPDAAERSTRPKQQEVDDAPRRVQPSTILKPSSSYERDKASSKPSTFMSSRDWTNKALPDITNTVENKPCTQPQSEKSPLLASVVRRARQTLQAPALAPHALSSYRLASGSSRSSGPRGQCTKTGRDCLFYKKDIALLPPLSRTVAICEMLDKHEAVAIDIEKFIEGKVGGRRQVLLVDMTADSLESGYDMIRATHTYDARGRKQWVDIYNWHLLGFISAHGTCGETSQKGWRRYWVGTA